MSYVMSWEFTQKEQSTLCQSDNNPSGGGGGVPVGTIVYQIATTKAAYGYLYADGAILPKVSYPELWAWIEDNASTKALLEVNATQFKIPDMRGRYIKGGLEIGVHQEDAIRNITGETAKVYLNSYSGLKTGWSDGTGAYEGQYIADTGWSSAQKTSITGSYNGPVLIQRMSFDASRVVPTATENRPKTVILAPAIKAF